MGLKDDFLEALTSVKRDLFNSSESAESNNDTKEVVEEAASQELISPVSAASVAPMPMHESTPEDEISPAPMPDNDVFDAFMQASAISDDSESNSNDELSQSNNDDDSFLGSSVSQTFSALDSESKFVESGYENLNDADKNDEYADSSSVEYSQQTPDAINAVSPPAIGSYGNKVYDFDRTDLYSDDKTIISKNTVIRGALQTDDSIRLLGQVLGDIDCKSNIVVAGKVRGNTSAANAYIMDAQVDGSLQCDDVVSVSSDAWVLGDIRAQQAEIDGKIKGNLDVRHAVSIGSTSSIIGNISTDELEIKRGAFINGQIMMYTPSRDVLDKFDHFEK